MFIAFWIGCMSTKNFSFPKFCMSMHVYIVLGSGSMGAWHTWEGSKHRRCSLPFIVRTNMGRGGFRAGSTPLAGVFMSHRPVNHSHSHVLNGGYRAGETEVRESREARPEENSLQRYHATPIV